MLGLLNWLGLGLLNWLGLGLGLGFRPGLGLGFRPGLGALILMAVVCGTASAQSTQISLGVSSERVEVGEILIVEVQITMPKGQPIEGYRAPQSVGLALVEIPGKVAQSELSEFGRTESWVTTTYRYSVVVKRAGRFFLEHASVSSKGETIESRDLPIVAVARKSDVSINAESEMQSSGFTLPKGRAEVLIHAFADKKEAWVGERITVSWLLFARTELIKYEPTPPSLAGMWSESKYEPTAFFEYSERVLGGKRYVVSLLSKRALYATRAGELEIAPLSAKIATLRTALGRFDRISSNILKVRIHSLPSPAPNGFDSSYVGRFHMQAEVDRTEVDVGQPLTLTLRVSGIGAMGRISAPRVEANGFSIEALRGGSGKEAEVLGESATRVFRYWVVPLDRESQRLPEIELIYFNDVTGEYESSRTEAITLKVRESQLSVSPPSDEPLPAEAELSASDSDSKVNVRTLLFWLAIALAGALLFWLVGLSLLKIRKN